MALERGYALDEASVRLLREHLLYWQRGRFLRAAEGRRPQPRQPMGSVVNGVRITSLTQDSGRYPGKWLEYDAANKTWADRDDIWVVDARGTALSITSGVRYLAVAHDFVNGRQLYVTDETVEPAAVGKVFAGAQVYFNGITIATATLTALTSTSEDYDTDGFHSNSSNTERLTVPGALGTSLVEVGHNLRWTGGGGTTPYLEAWLYQNGAGVDLYEGNPQANGAGGFFSMACKKLQFILSGSDYMEVRVRQNSGANMTIYGQFWMNRLN